MLVNTKDCSSILMLGRDPPAANQFTTSVYKFTLLYALQDATNKNMITSNIARTDHGGIPHVGRRW
jgi:hypothetical protein